MQLSRGPKVHFARPAIDRLFSSAALLLIEANRYGAHGFVDIKGDGGMTFVQKPKESAYPIMPLSGLQDDAPAVVSLQTLPDLLMALATGQLTTI